MIKMGSRIPVSRTPMFKVVTDLDDEEKRVPEVLVKPRREKNLKTLAGNFQSRRAKSSDGFRITDKKNVRQLLEIKDNQIEKLVEKLSSLIEYNGQFAKENDRLVGERVKLDEEMVVLTEKVAELQGKQCEECGKAKEAVDLLKTSYEKHKKENYELKNDIKMMKTLVFRLNVQIERYQTFFREHRQKDDSVYKLDFDHVEDASWGSIRSNILAPLLNAYEETIQEKTDMIQQFEQKFSEFTGQLKSIMVENERIHKEKDELKKSNEIWTQERCRLQAQVDLYRNKADVQGKRADLGKEKLVEVLRVYEQKVQSQALDIERLQEAYSRCKGELTTMRHLQQKPENVVDGLRECQRLFEELKLQHDKERERLIVDARTLSSKYDEQQQRLHAVEEENRNLRVEHEKRKAELLALNEKYAGLKQNIHRIRQSKELLRTRLKNVIDWSKGLEEGKVKMQTTWNDISHIEALLAQKETQIQSLQIRHQAELDSLQRRLRSREDTLKKFLVEKTERK